MTGRRHDGAVNGLFSIRYSGPKRCAFAHELRATAVAARRLVAHVRRLDECRRLRSFVDDAGPNGRHSIKSQDTCFTILTLFTIITIIGESYYLSYGQLFHVDALQTAQIREQLFTLLAELFAQLEIFNTTTGLRPRTSGDTQASPA